MRNAIASILDRLPVSTFSFFIFLVSPDSQFCDHFVACLCMVRTREKIKKKGTCAQRSRLIVRQSDDWSLRDLPSVTGQCRESSFISSFSSKLLGPQSESDRIRCFVRARKGKAVLFFIFYIFLGPAFSFFVSWLKSKFLHAGPGKYKKINKKRTGEWRSFSWEARPLSSFFLLSFCVWSGL